MIAVTSVRALVIQDSPADAERLTTLLSRAGIEVELVPQGSTTLSLCRAHSPDVVLLDAATRVGDYSLLAELRANPATQNAHILLLTELVDPAGVLRALEAGVVDSVLAKPFNDERLLARVEHAFAHPRESIPSERVAKTLAPALKDARAEELNPLGWTPGGSSAIQTEPPDHEYRGQDYGDLRDLNTQRTILDAVGRGTLAEVVADYLDMLASSSAVYEENGDYALGIFTSGWCRTMDDASRRLCGTSDNREALRSGKWHCHESCWAASREAMRTGKPVDVACAGGIRLFAVPVMAGERIVGSMNFGYSNPPTDPARLRDLSVLYDVPVDELIRRSREYDRRPAFVVDSAKRHLQRTARLVGEMVQRHELDMAEKRAREQAEAANRLKDEFLATVSHELRTPLNAILGWASMLSSGMLAPEHAAKASAIIERNARAQAQLVEDILDVSRIITGKLRINRHPTDVAAEIEAALEVVRPAADAKGVHLEPVLDRELGPLLADAERLRQIFWNLLSNAVKFTGRGGRVTVHLVQRDSSYIVNVEDTGQGIAQEFLPHVFERFRQEDTGTTRKTGGLGLGLAIVRHIVELHGGSVQARSEGTGKGSLFTVRLPVSATFARGSWPPRASTAPRDVGAGRAASHALLHGIRVLVVDDEVDARDLVASALAQRGAQVVSVSSAAEAFEALQHEKPDVLVSDIGMPVEDGYSLIERVRALPGDRRGTIPAIALTAYARSEDCTRAMLAGYTTHAAKPIDPNDLALVVSFAAKRS